MTQLLFKKQIKNYELNLTQGKRLLLKDKINSEAFEIPLS